ncbi:MAG: carbohydrate-binding domain-containing protein [Acutalibacteraceae bacterium]
MKSAKSLLSILLSFSLILPAVGCANSKGPDKTLETAVPIESENESETTKATTQAQTQQESFDTYVILNDADTTIDGDGVTFENNVLTISEPGSYSIKGTLSNGHILVNSPDSDKKVKLYLNSVTIHCDDTAPIYIEESGKETVIILPDGSSSTLSDNADRTVPEDENAEYATAVIYSKDDLQIEGNGSLTIEANFNKGIFSKDDLQIRGGTLTVNSKDDAIRGKDSVEITGGSFNLTSGGDAIRTSNETDSDKGNILISDGTFTITSELDGIQAVSDLTISGGEFKITTGGGSGEIKSEQERGFGSFKGIRPPDSSTEEAQSENTVSSKAIKGKSISVKGGTFEIDSLDDAFHSDSSLSLTSGSLTVKSGDDGIHAETALAISGGNIKILQSYEGLEGETIKISDGTVYVVSSDDGMNAASSSEQSENPDAPWANAENNPPQNDPQENSQSPSPVQTGMTFGKNRPSGKGGNGGGMDSYNSANVIEISGGNITVNADGDGIDSNGDIKMSGGTVTVFGPESSGNGALDYAGSCVVTGGTLLAAGSSGMSQSVSSGSVPCVNISCDVSANTVFALLNEKEETAVCFTSPKRFTSVVFASDTLSDNEKLSAYTGGSCSGTNENGVYVGGSYTKGTLSGQYNAG